MSNAVRIREIALGEGIPKICVPLMARSLPELRRAAADAREAGADLVEWRADLFGDLNPEQIELAVSELDRVLGELPLIVTIRTIPEGGQAMLSREAYMDCCVAAASCERVSLVDLEVFGAPEMDRAGEVARLHYAGAGVIASSHNFSCTESEEALLRRFYEMEETEADVLKISQMAVTKEDAERMMRICRKVSQEGTDRPLIAISMGEMGVKTRYMGEKMGSCLTFGSVGEGSAPGQLPIGELKDLLLKVHDHAL